MSESSMPSRGPSLPGPARIVEPARAMHAHVEMVSDVAVLRAS